MKPTYALVGAFLLGACSVQGSDPNADPIALVTLGVAQEGPIAETVTLYGAVESGPEAQYILAAPAEALVAEVAAPAGSAVSAGQVVVQLQPSPATRADFAKAIADGKSASAALARAQRLRAEGLASDADVEAARAAAAAAEALSASASARSTALTLRARTSGHVDAVTAKPGDLVVAGAVVATLSRDGGQRVRFGVPPAIAGKLAPGDMLHIRAVGGGAPISIPITSVNPVVDPQTRLASVYAAAPRSRDLAPGLPLRAEAPVAAAKDALTIPYAALLDDGGQPYVFVVNNGVAHRHDVETGPSSGDRIAVAKGLSIGDQVIVQGGTAVEDGMKVRTK